MRYTSQQKEEALARIAEVGVSKASEELGISAQTLYKWQRESKAEAMPLALDAQLPADVSQAIAAIQQDNQALLQKLESMERELAALRESNERLKNALLAFIQ